MTPPQVELLKQLVQSADFNDLLRAMAASDRDDFLSEIEGAHIEQNPARASMNFGRLHFMENLPDWFSSVYRDNAAKQKSV